MKLSGNFTIIKTNIVTGEKSEITCKNIITNNYYSLLKDGSNSSIGFYLWTSPYSMEKSRRRLNIESSSMFLNDAYGYMPQTDWFARYILAEENQPGYFETRCRIDPPSSGTRTISSIIMSDRQPRVDSITGLLPEQNTNAIVDIRSQNNNSIMTKMNIYAFVTLETPCIQTEIEIYDLYYRVIFDNNYADVNIPEISIEMIGKQSTAKMPTLQNNVNDIISTPCYSIPSISKWGPINFIGGSLQSQSFYSSNGDTMYDYNNMFQASRIVSDYYVNYTISASKDISVGKIISCIYPIGKNSMPFLSGYKSISPTSTIGNTHSHNNVALYPYFDPSNLATGLGYCTMSSTTKPTFPEFIEVNIETSGTNNTASYKIKKMPFTGTYKNTYSPLPIEVPNLSQIVVNKGNWRNGTYYNSYDYAHGFLSGRPGTHPSLSGLSYDTNINPYGIISRMTVSEYSGLKAISKEEIIGYDHLGVSIFKINGEVRSINKYKVSNFMAEDIIQVSINKTTNDIFVACRITGLYKVNNQLNLSYKIIPTNVGANEKCYGVDSVDNKILAVFDSGIYYSDDYANTWTKYDHIDYDSVGLSKNKIYGIRANLSNSIPNAFILFNNIDYSYSTSKTNLLGIWWNQYSYSIVDVNIPMMSYGVSPSFLGIDFVILFNNLFYFIFHSAQNNKTTIKKITYGSNTPVSILEYSNTTTDGIPLFIRKNNIDYIIYCYGSSIGIYNLTANSQTGNIDSYGQKTETNSVAMYQFNPFYSVILENGLVFYRGTSQFSQNIYNSGSNPNIRNNNVNETAETIITKIINPFFGKSYSYIFDEVYGWDGNQFSENSTSPKTISQGVNSFNGIDINFTGFNNVTDFISTEKYTTVRLNGFLKDNASLFKAFFSNSNYLKSEIKNQSGTITQSNTFYNCGKFEVEEGNIKYTNTHYLIDKRTTPFDFFRLSKIPQEAGTFKIIVDNLLTSAYAVSFSGYKNPTNTSKSFGIIFYPLNGKTYVNISNGYVNYQKSNMITPSNQYTPVQLNNGDIVEVSWKTGTQYRLFTLKVNGSIIFNNMYFDGSVEARNNSRLYCHYNVLTVLYPSTSLSNDIYIPVPKIRYDSTDTLIIIPLEEFVNDNYGLTINPDNYGENGDLEVKINNTLSNNNGIKVPATVNYTEYFSPREIILGDFYADSLSGSLYFSIYDLGKQYSSKYIYYKDSDL